MDDYRYVCSEHHKEDIYSQGLTEGEGFPEGPNTPLSDQAFLYQFLVLYIF